jgi:putative CocE/NonD family hydrolase
MTTLSFRARRGIRSWPSHCSSLVSLGLTVSLGMTSAAGAQVIDTNVAVPMRDGVVLRGDLYRPTRDGRFPTLVYRTPYGKHQSGAAIITARKATQRGYAVLMQDVRGRYASGGEFLPYQQEGKDGYDTIEWAAKQPWSTGWVGTYGLSYPGAVQWLAAVENPPSLKAMVPAMTFASPMQFWYSNGVWDNSWIGWITANIAEDRLAKLGIRDTISRAERGICTTPKDCSTSATFRRVAPWYFEWQKHPAYDPWWSWADLSDKYGRTNAAVLNFSAWYDDAYGPHGAINNYLGLVRARGGPRNTRLIMGPWTHGVPRGNRTTAGERSYGDFGLIDYDSVVIGWMDEHRLGRPQPDQLPVRTYVFGSNMWINAATWPLPNTTSDTLHLWAAGGGRWEARATTSGPLPASRSVIVSDPATPVTDEYNRAGAHDYRRLTQRDDVVIFESQPLARDKMVVGAMRAELFVSADAPDTDIWVKVFDVAPDGTAFNLMTSGLDVVRASYRNGRRQRELLVPGRVYQITLPDLFAGNTFRKGHRVRVAVMTSFAPNFSHNLHTGALEVGDGAASTGRVARVTIHHDAQYPSRLILPTLPQP